jgi:hypothetical protein
MSKDKGEREQVEAGKLPIFFDPEDGGGMFRRLVG